MNPQLNCGRNSSRVSQWIEENTYSFMNGIHLPASSGGAAGQTGKSPSLVVSRYVFLPLQSVQGGPGWGPDGNPSPLLPCSHRPHRQRQSFHGWPSLILKFSKCPYAKSPEPACFNPQVAESYFHSWSWVFTSV